jgi:hypothetical protein
MDEVARELCGTASCTERQRKCVRVWSCLVVKLSWPGGLVGVYVITPHTRVPGTTPYPPKTPNQKISIFWQFFFLKKTR